MRISNNIPTSHLLLGTISLATCSLYSPLSFSAEKNVDDKNKEIELIQVTARKRTELITDVPMYITAMTPDKLEALGIDNAQDLVGRLPSISQSGDFLSPGKDFAMMVVRGVGANGGMEPAAPVFIDGVYMPRLGIDTGFSDIKQIEVLYGPQSTLFGRNTEAGAFNIITRRPDENTRARVQFGYDDFNTFTAKGSVSGQIGEELFGSISIEGMQTDGYLGNIGTNTAHSRLGNGPGAYLNSDLTDTQDPDSGRDIRYRASLRWFPTDDIETYLTVDSQTYKGGYGLPGVPKGCDCYDLDVDSVFDADSTNQGAMLNIEISTDLGFDITSITAHRSLKNIGPFDFDGGSSFGPTGDPTPVGDGAFELSAEIPGVTNSAQGNVQDFRFTQKVTSQEIRITSSSGDDFQWLGGLYYFDETLYSDRNIDMLGANGFSWYNSVQDVDVTKTGWAVFAQSTYDFNDDIQFSAGLRYSNEESEAFTEMEWHSPLNCCGGLDFENPDNANGGSHTTSIDFDNVNFSTSLRWTINDNITTFITIADAYKSGGYQLGPLGVLPDDNPYDAETATSYEWGFKANMLDRRLEANLSMFNIDLEDQQVRSIKFVDGVQFTSTQNAASANSKGINLEVIFNATDNVKLNMALGYVKAEFDEFKPENTDLDFSGESLRFVPEITANIGAEWIIPTSNKWFDYVTLMANWQYVDDQVQGFEGLGLDVQYDIDAYHTGNIGAHFQINESTKASFYVNNVTNEYNVTREWNVFFFSNPGGANRAMSTVAPPRSFGFKIDHKF